MPVCEGVTIARYREGFRSARSGGGTPSWKILQSTGSIEDGTFVLQDPGIPFEAQILDESTTLAEPFGPRITDVDGELTPPQKLAYNWVFYDAMGRVTKRITPWNAATNYRYYGRRVEVHGPSGALTVGVCSPVR
ncbi:MAG: hypothetical protein L6Q76_31500 [Polyangiaceae bacterium]|nr:hypothetical protein [Polyangiaceae bacterium]